MTSQINIHKKFVVCKCLDPLDNTEFVEAAPFTFFRDQKLFWPKSQRNLKKRNTFDPVNLDEPDQWTQCQIISIKGVCDYYYYQAMELVNQLLECENTEEEVDNLVKLSRSRKTIRHTQTNNNVEQDDFETMMTLANEAENKVDSVETGAQQGTVESVWLQTYQWLQTTIHP